MNKKIDITKGQDFYDLNWTPGELFALIGESETNNVKLILLNPTSIKVRSDKYGSGINVSMNKANQIPEKWSIHYQKEAHLFQRPIRGKQGSLTPKWAYFRSNENIGYDFTVKKAIVGEDNIKKALSTEKNNLGYYSQFICDRKIKGLPNPTKQQTGLLKRIFRF